MAKRKTDETVIADDMRNENSGNGKLYRRTGWYGGGYGGLLLVVLGIYFLLLNFGFINFDLGKLWPLLLIVPGIYILFGGKKGSNR